MIPSLQTVPLVPYIAFSFNSKEVTAMPTRKSTDIPDGARVVTPKGMMVSTICATPGMTCLLDEVTKELKFTQPTNSFVKLKDEADKNSKLNDIWVRDALWVEFEISFKDIHGKTHSYTTRAHSVAKARANVLFRLGSTLTTYPQRIVPEAQKYVASLSGLTEYDKSLLKVTLFGYPNL